MAFDLDEKYIADAEVFLKAKLPHAYREAMKESNGGEIADGDRDWLVFPIADKSDRKRISRTCNNIISESNSCMKWPGFPQNSLAIASDGEGNYLIFQQNKEKPEYEEGVYLWEHETGSVEPFSEDFSSLEIL